MSKFVNKDSLAQSVSTQLNLSKADGLKAVNIIFDEMSEIYSKFDFLAVP